MQAEAVVSYDQDDAFRLWKLGVQGTAPIEHGYDANDALTQAGSLTILRDPQTSLPDITRAGAVETNLDVSQFGEPERFVATFAGQPLAKLRTTRDALGRITHIDEVIAGQSRSVISTTTTTPTSSHTSRSRASPRASCSTIPTATSSRSARLASGCWRARTTPRTACGHTAISSSRTRIRATSETKLDIRTGERTTYRYDEFGNLLGVEPR